MLSLSRIPSLILGTHFPALFFVWTRGYIFPPANKAEGIPYEVLTTSNMLPKKQFDSRPMQFVHVPVPVHLLASMVPSHFAPIQRGERSLIAEAKIPLPWSFVGLNPTR